MFEIALTISFALLSGALLLTFGRLVAGPTVSDRVVALDLIGILVVGFTGLYALRTGVPDFLDVAIVMALMGFLATVGFARYLEEGGKSK